MEIKFDIKTIIIIIFMIMFTIGVFVLRYQNHSIEKLNEIVKQEQVDDSLQQVTDSIKFKQLQFKTYSDSLATAKLYREKELNLIKKFINKKIIKHEDLIKALPNASDAVRDSIWKSELTKSERRV